MRENDPAAKGAIAAARRIAARLNVPFQKRGRVYR
jgi:hypothetical protein